MIIGIGTDIVQIPRIERLLEKFQDSFVTKILSIIEKEQYNILAKDKKAAFLAKRFAAKEAVSKAFGTGIGKGGITFQDITIYNDELGKPMVKISSDTGLGNNIFLSISDDYPIAVAFAVVSQ